jgi:hypothetical protein
MNELSPKVGRYTAAGILILSLFIILGWFAFHEERSLLDQHPAQVEQAKPQARLVEPTPIPEDNAVTETPTNQPTDSAVANAADLYRQAFDLFNALTNTDKELVSDWRTNVDAAVEAELCEKLRPICELMHQASTVTNCDWGIDPTAFDAKLPHLTPARSIARAAIWHAARCRSNNVAGATEDLLSALLMGRNVSRSALIGYLVDQSVQDMVSTYVAQNLETFRGPDAHRLASAINDPAYEEEPSRAIEQEADIIDHFAAHLASLPATEAEKQFSKWGNSIFLEVPTNLDQATTLTALKQVADSERELAKVLASASEDEYQTWLQHWTELQASNPLAKGLLGSNDYLVDKIRRAEVQRQMVIAGLAVGEDGTETLAAHPDPSSGKPFVYTETDDGFELQSTFIFNDKPYKIRFK